MDVTINDPVDNAIHCSQVLGLSFKWLQYLQSKFQAASKGSPMTVTINGDNVEETNQIEVTQNAADEASELTCVPDCPQEEYVYDYQYSDNGGDKGGHSKPKPAPKPAAPKPKPTPPQATAAPKPLGPPTHIDDSYGSSNYDEYDEYDQGNDQYDQETVLFNDYDYEVNSDDQTQQQQDSSTAKPEKSPLSETEFFVVPQPLFPHPHPHHPHHPGFFAPPPFPHPPPFFPPFFNITQSPSVPSTGETDYAYEEEPVVDVVVDYEYPEQASDDYAQVDTLPSDKYSDYEYDYEEPAIVTVPEPAPAPTAAPVPAPAEDKATQGCPGGDLETCIDVCPGFNKVAFGLCVAECGKRCP